MVLVAVAVAGAAILVPTRVANAAFNATTTAAGTVSTLTVPTKTAVGCSWDTRPRLTVSWTNPNATDSAQVLVATTSGGSTTVGATAAAGATSVAYTPAAPLTTVQLPLDPGGRRHLDLGHLARDADQRRAAGPSTLFAGTGTAGFAGDGGAATAATLNAPLQTVEAPDGRVFVADSANNRIRVISTAGMITTFAGGTGAASACTFTGPVATLRLNAPRGVAVDARRQRLHRRHRRQLHPQGRHRRQRHPRSPAAGRPPPATPPCTATALSLSSPSDLAVDTSGALIVADTGRNCVRQVTAHHHRTRRRRWRHDHLRRHHRHRRLALAARSASPSTASDNVYIADTGRNCVRKVAGTTVTVVAGGGATTACTATTTSTAVSLSTPQDVAVDADRHRLRRRHGAPLRPPGRRHGRHPGRLHRHQQLRRRQRPGARRPPSAPPRSSASSPTATCSSPTGPPTPAPTTSAASSCS